MTTEIYDGLNNSFYNTNAEDLAEQYLSKSFEEVHASWLSHLKSILNPSSVKSAFTPHRLPEPSHIANNPSEQKAKLRFLDIGAGAGRDVKYLAEQGTTNQSVQVYAVEPAQTLANLGKRLTQDLNVTWLDDALPVLSRVISLDTRFDLILLSAIWMHIPTQERADSIRTFAKLLDPNGKLVITLRHGPCSDERQMFQVSDTELVQLAKSVGLTVIDTTANEADKLGRAEVYWQTLVLVHASVSTASMRLLKYEVTL
ncbi:class I SAM-dependent methyltransferase [Shewanella eurypsychrophilus]|uniref:Class I SAM-dependent methyltransferase n=1 Tax=Shewanella eurypsychrophilus TaxID=2593656 RepID=A0ABX6V699_9GAMM|nr:MULTISPECIES: class I SAM-dependent methyltransferase [Shewanella]QFU22851.1 methyltransferase domain-containing protein [Shewanella sp. YLB-09]QPG58138.1 class I SAM-dependent methyltransferase [Shewanella eurypsychrophilus]